MARRVRTRLPIKFAKGIAKSVILFADNALMGLKNTRTLLSQPLDTADVLTDSLNIKIADEPFNSRNRR